MSNNSKTAPTNGTQKQLPNSTTANGKNPNGTTEKTVGTVVSLPVKKEEVKQPEKHVDEPKPIEDRVLKVQMLGDLVERRDKLLETQRKLNSFKLSSDGSRDKLSINDGKSNEFLTTNSAVIKDVIETLKVSIQQKLDDVEKQIVF